MDDVLLLLILVVGAFYAGWRLHEYFTIMVIEHNPEVFEEACKAARAGTFLEKDDEHEYVEMETEVHNGVVYAYNKANGQFLAQGTTVTQAAIAASMRFKGVAFTHPDLELDEEDQKA
jgi:gamma-glutamyl:cysteine ligase YbdK (ATP-grasp superfamily)